MSTQKLKDINQFCFCMCCLMVPTLALLNQILHKASTIIKVHNVLFKAISLIHQTSDWPVFILFCTLRSSWKYSFG